jgi:hypothetical protein
MATKIAQDAPDIQSRNTAMADVVRGIKPVDDDLGSFRALFFAKQKVGKTTLGASSGLNTLLVEADPAGTEVLSGRGYKNVTRYNMTRWEQEDGLFWYLQSQDHPHEVAVIDTITMWTTLCLRYVMGQEQRLDPLMPKSDHWQKLAQIMNNAILRWVSLPIHVVFLAQERMLQEKNDEGEMVGTEITAAMNPASLQVLKGAVGTIGHLYIDQTHKEVLPDGTKVAQRRMHLKDHPLYAVGTRVRGLPSIMANPTLASIMDIRAKTGELPPEELNLFGATAVDEDEEIATEDDAGVVLEAI